MKITVCIGSSCHIKGSRRVLERFEELIRENNVGDRVDLGGTFCTGQCQKGICVKIDEKLLSVTAETADEFFAENVLAVLNR